MLIQTFTPYVDLVGVVTGRPIYFSFSLSHTISTKKFAHVDVKTCSSTAHVKNQEFDMEYYVSCDLRMHW